MINCAKALYREDGLKSLCKGTGLTLFRGKLFHKQH